MQNNKFDLRAPYKPTGDQPDAIAKLTAGVEAGLSEQTLLGVTGSGKTFTMANIIANVNRPTLVLAHNKTLAAQLCSEFREFFPNNAVEYFVSYYDYYQPEAYIPGKDMYIENQTTKNGNGAQRIRSRSGGTSSSSPASPASTAWATRPSIRSCKSCCAAAWQWSARSCSAASC